ncbi:DUF721 domain-containing protein [Synechococcus sp. RSCCF101]|uniref:DUF721 domain-containing protein n=1 Tax=Synechococcus sp. RSCCF101 TaxID=2511069 RepID=UPI001CD9802D|nr:DUF721 domain-containing protein [Synechococcus sp. RSCCF101]
MAACLDGLQRQWQREGHLAAMAQNWPRLVGEQLAPHCRPLALRGSVLTVGAQQPQWRQALLYSRHRLLGVLMAAGHRVREIRIVQAGPLAAPGSHSREESEQWQRHPSRVDVHGMETCPLCGSPAPAGELARWGHCGFCRRRQLAGTDRGGGAPGRPPQ